MKTTNRFVLAAGIAGAVMLAVATAAIAEPQHPQPLAHSASAAPEASDAHVVALYALTKDVLAQGDKVDRAAVMAKLTEIAKGHAEETKTDPAAMQAHAMEMFHAGIAAAQKHPEIMASVETFHAALHDAGAAQGPEKATAANPHGEQGTQTLQPGAGEWMANPHMHDFYEATKAAFANGPRQVDRKAYEAKSHEIFDAFADSMHMDRAAIQDHLKLIPGQMVDIVKADPKVLDSYENFTVALVGPQ